jgi:hypothetical protein
MTVWTYEDTKRIMVSSMEVALAHGLPSSHGPYLDGPFLDVKPRAKNQ